MMLDMLRCLNVWDELEWRHHTTGLLQAYMPNDKTRRVHIWNRLLKTRDVGELHNHRFLLRSRVLVGSITHERLLPHVRQGFTPTHDVWDIPGASKGSTETLRWKAQVEVERYDRQRFCAGDAYAVPKWQYHHARQEDDDAELTVTYIDLVDKDLDAAASLLCPVGVPPSHAFDDPPDSALVTSLVHDAKMHLHRAMNP